MVWEGTDAATAAARGAAEETGVMAESVAAAEAAAVLGSAEMEVGWAALAMAGMEDKV